MLSRLRHYGFICGDDKHDQVDSANAGKHVLDEALVTGNVNETHGRAGVQIEVGEPEIDGDAPLFLFLQAIGIDAGKRLDERRFPVVDVSGSSYDNVRHSSSWTRGRGSPITLK